VSLSVAAVLLLGAAVAVILLSTGGKPATRAKSESLQLTDTLLASRQLYASTQQPSYSALLPAGWKQVASTPAGLSAATTVQSPVDGGARITVGQIERPARSLSGEARAMLSTARSRPGFQAGTNAAATLAGGRRGWVLGYGAGGQSTATYLVSSCGNTYAVSASVPPARVAVLRARIAIVAGTLQGNC
jgi:hypothetical protein